MLYSPGILLGPWSPSLGNVTVVPSFQPRFTVIVRIFSRVLVVRPSSFSTWWEGQRAKFRGAVGGQRVEFFYNRAMLLDFFLLVNKITVGC